MQVQGSPNVTISIDPEFKALIPPLTTEEREQLERNVLEDGIRDPLVLWDGVIVDGHNRYDIALYYDLPFDIVSMDFDSRDEAKLWIFRNQLGRRNLSDMQRIAMARKVEDAIRAEARERYDNRGNQYTERSVENFPPSNAKARDELGKMAGVSGKTYEHGVYAMENAPEPVVDAAMRDELSVNAAYEVAKMGYDDQCEIMRRIEEGETPKNAVREVRNRPHVANNSGNNEWYTPPEYIEAAREVMGGIDLDPASSAIANQTVGAEEYYTEKMDGLSLPWHGRIWMNPPYSSDRIGRFMEKLEAELPGVESAVILVNNATDTQWFARAVGCSSAVCFPTGRVKFLTPDGRTGAPLQGQAVLYVGEEPERFREVFGRFGWTAAL